MTLLIHESAEKSNRFSVNLDKIRLDVFFRRFEALGDGLKVCLTRTKCLKGLFETFEAKRLGLERRI